MIEFADPERALAFALGRPGSVADGELVQAAAEGDSVALTAIYNRYSGPLYRYCRSIVRDPDDARDVMHETIANAIDSIARQPVRDLKPWLYRIAYNESLSLLRRRRRREAVEVSVGTLVASREELTSDATTRERLDELVSDLRDLSRQQRCALLMRELLDFDYERIAAAIGASPEAARRSVADARTALRELREGRSLPCASVQSLLAADDARLLRGRRVRAHIGQCPSCRDLRAALRAGGAAPASRRPSVEAIAV